jgi:hypothetical protein
LEHFKKLQENLEFHQNKCHPRDVPDMRRQCAKAANQWAQGVAGQPNPLANQSGFMSVWLEASGTRVYTRRGWRRRWRKSVEAESHSRPAMLLGRLATTWRVTNLTKPVTPPWTPIIPLYWWKSEHTPHFGDSTCKAPILSVVARHSLVGRMARL